MIARPATLLVAGALLALAAAPAAAQHEPARPAHAAEAAAPAPAASAVDPVSGELVETQGAPGKDAKIEHLVSEDSQVRIDETRVRGVTRKIVVHSKITGGSYEIQPRDPSLAPENDHGAGMRTFSFKF